MIDPLAAGAAALACGIAGALVPAVVARVPEPAPAESPDPAPPKELYADIAALPGLAWKSAVASAAGGALVALGVGGEWALLELLPFVPVGVALALIDWRTRLLPTRLVAPSYVLVGGLVVACWVITRDTDDLVRAGLGWIVAGGLFFTLWFIYPPWMGYGDVRLAGVLGIAIGYLGWPELLLGLWSGFLLGGVSGTLLSALRIVDRRDYPFGPFMLVGALVGILAGGAVLGG